MKREEWLAALQLLMGGSVLDSFRGDDTWNQDRFEWFMAVIRDKDGLDMAREVANKFCNGDWSSSDVREDEYIDVLTKNRRWRHLLKEKSP